MGKDKVNWYNDTDTYFAIKDIEKILNSTTYGLVLSFRGNGKKEALKELNEKYGKRLTPYEKVGGDR